MNLKGNIVLILIGLFGLCGAQAPWTSEETDIIYHKVRSLFTETKNSIRKQMRKKGFNHKNYTPNTNFPSPAKVHMNESISHLVNRVTILTETCQLELSFPSLPNRYLKPPEHGN